MIFNIKTFKNKSCHLNKNFNKVFMVEVDKQKIICGFTDLDSLNQNYANIDPYEEHSHKNYKIIEKWIKTFNEIIVYNETLKSLVEFIKFEINLETLLKLDISVLEFNVKEDVFIFCIILRHILVV